MTACLAGEPRPWHIALSSYRDRSLAEPVLAALRRSGDIIVGDNQPYDLDPEMRLQHSVPCPAQGMQHLQAEFRQDEITEAAIPSSDGLSVSCGR